MDFILEDKKQDFSVNLFMYIYCICIYLYVFIIFCIIYLHI